MNARTCLSTLSFIVGVFFSAQTQGGILAISNQVIVALEPPPNVTNAASFNDNLIFAFQEQASLAVTNPVTMNITRPGTYTNQTQVVTGSTSVVFTGPVDSYFFHHNGFGSNNTATATVVFDSDILGIICTAPSLNATHTLFGAPGTIYSTLPTQGYEFGVSSTTDRVIFHPDGRTVTITTSAPFTTLDDMRIITVSGSNLPPVASAGLDQSVTEFQTVVLDGSASFDPNSPPLPLMYFWSQLSGIPVILNGENTATPTFVAPDAPDSGAVLVFQLTVFNGYFPRTDTVAVNINFVNSPPTAHAGTNQVVAESSFVTLNGSASTDPENDFLTFQWSQVSGPTVNLIGGNTNVPFFIAPSVSATQGSNQLQFQLVVNDGFVSSAPSTVTVTVLNVNDTPIANAGSNQVVSELAFVTLNGSASRDPDGNPLSYAWTQILGPIVALSGTNTTHPTFTAPQLNVGGTNFSVTLTFRLTVSDGTASSSSTVNVRVNNVNHGPIADAGPDQTVPEGEPVTLDGTGSSDADGDPILFSWFQIGGTSVTLTAADSAAPTFVAPEVGPEGASLTFLLLVQDAFGFLTVESTNAVVIHVTDVNHPPIVLAGPAQSVNEGELATLSGTASDPDGNTLAISWTQVSGPAVTLINPTTLTPAFVAPFITRDDTNVILRLTADDGFGGVNSDDVSIHIANINHPPVAQPPANMTVPEGTEVTLVGQGTDPDTEEQSQLIYTWAQTAGPEVELLVSGSSASFVSPIVTAGGDPDAKVTLSFVLTVIDPNGAFGTNGVDVVVANVDHSPTAVAGNNLTVNEASSVTLNGSGSSDPDGDPLSFAWVQTAGPSVSLLNANTAFPQFTAPFVNFAGATLQFRLTVDDGFGGTSTATVTVTVNNINDPPNVSQAQPSVSTLWPPNHTMVEVSIVGVIDPNDNNTISITGVTQDEPTSGTDIDDEPIDAVINTDGTVLLRAERSAGGNGRVYHIHFTASDFEGSTSSSVEVTVPKSKKTDGAVDDGELYDSTQ